MLNSYYAEILDAPPNSGLISYGYTFRAKNIREAKLHALEVSREMEAVPLPFVARISHSMYVKLSEKYTLPTMIRITDIDEVPL